MSGPTTTARAETAPPTRLRRGLRIARRVLVWTLATVFVLIAALLIVLHTDWGREQLRRRFEATLQERFAGEVRVGRLEGSVLTELELRDVTIEDDHGRPAISLDRVTTSLALSQVWFKAIHLETLEVSGVEIVAREDEDGINLARLTREVEPSTWNIIVSVLSISDARVEYIRRDGRVEHFDGLTIEGRVDLPADDSIDATLAAFTLWRERATPIRLDVDAHLTADGAVTLAAARASLADIVVTATDVSIIGDAIEGEIAVVAPEPTVRRFAPDLELGGDVAIAATIAPVLVTPGGAVPAYTASLDAEVGEVRARGDATFTIDRERTGIAMVSGMARLVGRGRFDRYAIDELVVDATLAAGRITAAGELRSPGEAQLAFDAALLIPQDGAPELERGRVHGAIAQLDVATAGLVPASGAVEVDVSARGRLDDLAVAGTVRGRDLRHDQTMIGAAVLAIDARGLPGDPAGAATLSLTRIRHAGQVISALDVEASSRGDDLIDVHARSRGTRGPWLVDARALVTLAPDRIAVALGDHHVRIRGVDLRGAGGRVVVTPTTIEAERISTRIARGTVAIDGTYRRAGRGAGGFEGAVRVTGLDLEQVDKLLGIGKQLNGRADLSATFARNGHGMTGSVEASIHGARLDRRGSTLDLVASASLTPGRVVVALDADADRFGTVSMALDVDAPRRIDDPDAWRRLDRKAIRAGHLRATAIDLGGVGDLLQMAEPVRGRLDAELSLTPDGSAGTLAVRDVDGVGLPGKLDADFTIDTAASAMTVTGDARIEAVGTASASLSVDLPGRPFAIDAWKRLDQRAFRGGKIEMAGILFDAELLRRLGIISPWRGRARVAVELAPELAFVGAVVDVDDVRGGPFRTPVAGKLTARFADAEGLRVQVETYLDEAGLARQALLSAEAAIPLRTDDLFAEDPAAAIGARELTARVTMADVPARAIAAAMGRGGGLRGTVSLDATVKGTVATPRAEAALVLKGLGTRRATIEELRVDGTFDAATGDVVVEARGRQQGGGSLALDARATLDRLADARVSLRATDFDLSPLARLSPDEMLLGVAGRLDADLQADGLDLATARLSGVARLRDAELPVHPLVGTMRDGDVSVSIQRTKLIVTATGRVGRGTVSLDGEATLDGLRPIRGHATLEVDKVRLINELQPTVTASVRAELTRDADVWRPRIVISNAVVRVPEESGAELHDPEIEGDIVFVENGRPPPAATAPPPRRRAIIGQRPRRPYLIATVELQSTRVISPELRGFVSGKLTATVGEEAIAIDGSISGRRADLDLYDRRYRVERAEVRFDGSADPLLDIVFTHEFPDLTLKVAVSGRLSEPRLALTSIPPTYTEGQLLTFLVGGAPGSDPGSEVRDAATGVASTLLSQKIGSYASPYLPIDLDVLRFEAATTRSSAAFTLGKWLTPKLFVAYRRRVEPRADQNSGEAELEYWLSRRLVLDGVVGDRGVHGVDLLWTRRW